MGDSIQAADSWRAVAVTLVISGWSVSARAQSALIGWGDQVFDSRWNDEAFVEISAGGSHTIARRADGSVVAWGANGSGECVVPALPSGITYEAVAAGGTHSVAHRSDGALVAWGRNNEG